ncbi:hypothetical protein B0T22DRAFT_457160 [Podospora appendiculata]|uniref:Uncharacterized protein n=1 Tax=Podospora appendiculata TaxID=314037 RepID=A0AAE0X7T8_9PEZI|nr:hypothetical protein B0T22DRAFT_457160 [Podospora appendiculata]
MITARPEITAGHVAVAVAAAAVARTNERNTRKHWTQTTAQTRADPALLKLEVDPLARGETVRCCLACSCPALDVGFVGRHLSWQAAVRASLQWKLGRKAKKQTPSKQARRLHAGDDDLNTAWETTARTGLPAFPSSVDGRHMLASFSNTAEWTSEGSQRSCPVTKGKPEIKNLDA